MNIDALCRAIRAFESYVDDAQENFLQPRDRLFKSLPKQQQAFLQPLQDHKRQNCVLAFAHNGELAGAIARHARQIFSEAGLADVLRYHLLSKSTKPKNEDHAIVRATLRQIWRDWSQEAHREREACYRPVIDEIQRRFASQNKQDIRVLIPGCGLGRLAYELAGSGYNVEANDVSYVTLLASAFIMSRDPSPSHDKYILCPWVTQFSNHQHTNRQFATYEVPTAMSTSGFCLAAPMRLHSTNAMQFSASFTGQGGTLVMNDKDFTQDLGSRQYTGQFDVVATCFFVDTAKNLLEYINIIKHVLRPGGVWINVGPLLWNCYENGPGGRREGDVDVDEDQRARQGPLNRHVGAEWDEKLEFSFEEVLMIIQSMGMSLEQQHFVDTAGYVMDDESMLRAKYRLAFWVAKNTVATEQMN